MPVYEFVCQKCGHDFSLVVSISAYTTTKFTCPECQSDQVKRQLSAFHSITRKKS